MFTRLTLVVLIALSWASPCGAAKRDPVMAEQLFNEGRLALEQHAYVAACKLFEESDHLDPAVGTLMNWATCEERRGRIASAWQLWQEALDRMDPTDDRVAHARAQTRSLEPRIPRLTVKAAAPLPATAKVYRDGVHLRDSTLNIPLRVDPGSHVVLVRMPGRKAQQYRIDLAEQERREVTVSVGDRLPVSEQSRKTGAPMWGYILTGVGVAAIGGAVVSHVLIDDRERTVAANCPNKRCNAEGLTAVREGKALLIANRVGWAVGGTALAGGIALLLFQTGEPREEQRVGLVLAPNRFGLIHQGRF